MTESANSKPHATSRVERSTTGPVGRPMTREEALAMRGSGWEGNLDQMRSGHVDETGHVADQR
ncbi:MAG: hypothetical protein M3096_01690 [Actinomycetia bacterium]|nr:hypothetical protein [Actinomycetes bacterium]